MLTYLGQALARVRSNLWVMVGNVQASLADWCQLGGHSQGRQLIDAGTDTCDGHACDEGVHGVGSRGDDVAND
jgi:hypothetical protein